MPQFVIRFQNLRKQLTRSPIPEELTEVFLTGLWKPLRTTLALVDLIGNPIKDVISRVLRLDSVQSMSMPSLQNALPTMEETRFRQAVLCTTYLNPGHFALECMLQTHCPINHLPIRQIELQTTQPQTSGRPAHRDNNKPRSRDRYQDDNRDWEDDYDCDDDYRRDDDYRHDYDYRRGNNYRRNKYLPPP